MPDLADGESVEIKGSAAKPYVLKNTGGVYSCSCPAWRNQGAAIELRTCKHLKKLRGEEAELSRVGAPAPRAPKAASGTSGGTAASAGATGATGATVDPPPILLAHSWDSERDLTGWWMSEKLDGVRAYWDGAQFLSRLGNRYLAPDWFVAELPPFPLDGELWVGRKQFQRTVSIVRRSDGAEAWRDVRYLAFDAPAHDAGFEARIEFLRAHFTTNAAEHAEALPHERCEGPDHLREELARVEALGGEGLMMRAPGSRYAVGRSDTLLKVKTFHDAEARVIGHVPGAGRHKGRLGALRAVTPEGIEFSVGTGLSDAQRDDPPAIGAIITYRFQELSNAGVPRFPSFVGVRHDFAWPGTPGTPAKAKAKSASKPAANAAPQSTPAPAGPAPSVSPSARRFQVDDGKSSKFWEIDVQGARLVIRYGKLGARGITQVKDFADEPRARAEADKLIASKTRKGYLEHAAGASGDGSEPAKR